MVPVPYVESVIVVDVMGVSDRLEYPDVRVVPVAYVEYVSRRGCDRRWLRP